jgi:ATP-dependent helicase Lhr and Lhr-like helicase
MISHHASRRPMWKESTADAAERLCLSPTSTNGRCAVWKFSETLPERLARATLAARLADLDNAAEVIRDPARFVGFA